LKEISLEIEESKKKIEQAKVPVGMTRQRSTKRLESRNIFSYLNKQQKMKERLLEAIDTFGLYYATKPFKGPWFDVRVLFEPMNDDTINNMLLQILGVEEYIQRRRKEREERKDFIESIKPENERASKHNMEKHKTQESAEQLPHEIDETKLKEREEQAEVISLSDVQETVDFIVKFIPEKPKKEIYSDILQTKEYSPAVSTKKPPKDTEETTDNVLPYLVNRFGTKTGNMFFHMRRVWLKDPLTKILIVSSYDTYLQEISDSLAKCCISSFFLRAANNMKHYMSWGKERVLLMNFNVNFWQHKTIEVSHVFLMNPVNVIPAKEAITIEDRAIKIAVPQKGRKLVVFVRFVISHSIEDEIFQVQTQKRNLKNA
jgi:hypothetical protein